MYNITKYVFLKNQKEIELFLDLVKNKNDLELLRGYKILSYKDYSIHKAIIKIKEYNNKRYLSCERHDYNENIVKDFENEIMTIEEYGDL